MANTDLQRRFGLIVSGLTVIPASFLGADTHACFDAAYAYSAAADKSHHAPCCVMVWAVGDRDRVSGITFQDLLCRCSVKNDAVAEMTAQCSGDRLYFCWTRRQRDDAGYALNLGSGQRDDSRVERRWDVPTRDIE